jgi:hypothetical protein
MPIDKKSESNAHSMCTSRDVKLLKEDVGDTYTKDRKRGYNTERDKTREEERKKRKRNATLGRNLIEASEQEGALAQSR